MRPKKTGFSLLALCRLLTCKGVRGLYTDCAAWDSGPAQTYYSLLMGKLANSGKQIPFLI